MQEISIEELTKGKKVRCIIAVPAYLSGPLST